MSQFERRLDHLDALCKLAVKPEWWNNLLALWRPSGVCADGYGLRLAIRNNYVSFYRRGQSIACVEIGRNGIPTATTHIKYVDASNLGLLGNKYLKLRGEWMLRDGKPWKRYEGMQTIKKWIATVDGNVDGKLDGDVKPGYVGIEKRFVDSVVAGNPNIIDLEMGLPAWGEQKTAPRMDIVEIEASPTGRNVVFWEAKRISDSRMRCRADMVPNLQPEVLKQLAAYERFLTTNDVNHPHRHLVTEAYRNTAKLLMKLRALADGLGSAYELGGEIVAAASEAELGVDPKPRLVLLQEDAISRPAWKPHAAKLEKAGIFMKTIEKDGPYQLREPA